MDDDSEHADTRDDSNLGAGETSLACNCCRRRKLRCSREVPTCQQCRKTGSDCVYEAKKAKPGMKAGAIDNLHRRLETPDALERAFHQQDTSGTNPATRPESSPDNELNDSTNNLLLFFAKELQRFNQGASSRTHLPTTTSRQQNGESPTKRLRTDNGFSPQTRPLVREPSVPEDEDLEALLQAYFVNVHPWIPMLHQGRLRRRLADEKERPKVQTILQSLVLVAVKYIDNMTVANRLLKTEQQAQEWRDYIVVTAMRKMSVENLQALIMITFDDIGSGRASQAWSVVGAMTRIVDYLQLAVETDEMNRSSIFRPYISLHPPADWTQAEERRRVFWNVFILDRFCSATTGWNTSLTSDDVHRRLPCDGITWRKEDPANTPYFGIWDKISGRIGNPLAFLPSHYTTLPPPPAQIVDDDVGTPSDVATSPGAPTGHVDMSSVGAFAYSIEATESLSRVTTYFLQQKVNMRDQGDLSRWLTRFKELDLRLVHWKMLLPQKWKANMARQRSRMDPNLTLAHVTHNTSMILLHQPIAYPNPKWPFNNRLPSLCSADTCEAAAVEIATIVDNFLRYAPPSVPVASQFAFCLYIASRVFLLPMRTNSAAVAVSPQFWSLLRSLDCIARRWAGPHKMCLGLEQTNLAAKYSHKLKELHIECLGSRVSILRPLGYTSEIRQTDDDSPWPISTPVNSGEGVQAQVGENGHPQAAVANDQAVQVPCMWNDTAPTDGNQAAGVNGPGMPFPVQPAPASLDIPGAISLTPGMTPQGNGEFRPPGPYHHPSIGTSDLGAISQILLDQQFVDMDRIITYDDGMFGSEFDIGPW
ncbi:hypothetical protein S40288_06383 [Stachybotrys chartarum IBT 40288]|nr:hypothetical protein S40288_06383 [Stachybotrys chartarum IBT 40288]